MGAGTSPYQLARLYKADLSKAYSAAERIDDEVADLAGRVAHLPGAHTLHLVRGDGHHCFLGQVLSAEQYAEFIAPYDDEVLLVYPNGGMIHLCGEHTQHIPVWRGMKSVRALQLNDRAAEDLEYYFKDLRDDQMLYVNPFDGMPVDRIMDITGGHRVVIVGGVEEPLPMRPDPRTAQ